ncbi:MAG: SMR family transporter, partial [Oscillospiraceae bacterium]|nr:SMR family transporter [Oscillospiraceae bacterium]
MFYLLLTILGGAMVSILMRLSESKIKNSIGMLEANYIACFLVSAASAGFGNLFPNEPGIAQTQFWGFVTGVLFLACYLVFQISVHRNGVVLSSAFSKLGLMVSIVMSIAFFGEKPTVLQTLGFLLAVGAICLMNYQKENTGSGFNFGLLLVLFFGGASDAMAKVFEELGTASQQPQYLFYTFLVALVLCTVLMLYKKQRLGRWEFLFGTLIAIPNFVSTRFMLKALADIPAVIAYPAFSVGTILVVTMAGVLFFKERLTKRQWIGIGV